jgi:hypothetical protein
VIRQSGTRPKGTELSRFNALRHGILSRYTVLPWEDGAESLEPLQHPTALPSDQRAQSRVLHHGNTLDATPSDEERGRTDGGCFGSAAK